MARGVEGRPIYVDDLDRIKFLEDMALVVAQSSAEIIAYCLMPNHFHLAIKVGLISLSAIMQRLMGGQAIRFNTRHRRVGHLFQGRHKANLCVDESYLRCLIRYIHMNPVRAGLVAAPNDWAWSSARKIGTPSDEDPDFDPWASRPALIRNVERRRMDMVEIEKSILRSTGVTEDELKSRCREARLVDARKRLSLAAIGEGHSIKTIADFIGTNATSISRYARK